MDRHTLSEKILSFQGSTGIDTIGVAKASQFVDYLLTQHQRRDPKLTMPNAKSIIVVGSYIGGVTLPTWQDHRYGRTDVRNVTNAKMHVLSMPLKHPMY